MHNKTPQKGESTSNTTEQTESEAQHADEYVTIVVLGRDPMWGCLRTSMFLNRSHMRLSSTFFMSHTVSKRMWFVSLISVAF